MHTDLDIVERVVRGDQRAYAELVRRYQDRGMALALRILRNAEEAEEALQDAFVRAYRSLPKFERRSTFSTWFYRILYNVCVTALGKRDSAGPAGIRDDPAAEPAEPASGVDVPAEEYERKEFLDLIREELGNLPPTYSAVLTLFFLHDMRYEEIAEVTGLPLGTVKVRLFRGRSLLRTAVLRRYGHGAAVPAGNRPRTQ